MAAVNGSRRTLRVFYESMGGELLCFEYQCSWQAADAAVLRLRPRRYLRPNPRVRGFSVTYHHGDNEGTNSMSPRAEIIHPNEPIPVTGARLIVLPSQMEA